MRTLVQQPLSLSQLLRQLSLDNAEGGAGEHSVLEQPHGAERFGASTAKGAAATGYSWEAEQEWLGGIAALAQLLLQYISRDPAPPLSANASSSLLGVVLSGPFPVLPDRILDRRLSTWLLLPETLDSMLSVARPMLPANGHGPPAACDLHTIPLGDDDPLAQERFCLLLTAEFALTLVLGADASGQPKFQFSFEPTVAEQVWQQLRDRILQRRPPLLTTLDAVVERFAPVAPDYRLVTEYSHLLMQQLRQRLTTVPQPEHSGVQLTSLEHSLRNWPKANSYQVRSLPPALGFSPLGDQNSTSDTGTDAELLKAMAHEIRTPLTTIRTLTRSLLKRQDLSEAVARRLRLIDQECTQQIDRFNLIFRAVELEIDQQSQPRSPLSALSLNQLFEAAIPQWQQQASRRNLTLEVEVPPQLPMVNSDPTMLNQVLTGLIDRFTHSLPPYSHIQLAVTLAGHQLKLQFQSHPPADHAPAATDQNSDSLLSSPFKALGQLLMFQPETGGLSLNLNVTKNLFQALGGKLIVRQRPQAGEVLTVFLPLETRTL